MRNIMERELRNRASRKHGTFSKIVSKTKDDDLEHAVRGDGVTLEYAATGGGFWVRGYRTERGNPDGSGGHTAHASGVHTYKTLVLSGYAPTKPEALRVALLGAVREESATDSSPITDSDVSTPPAPSATKKK